MQCHTRAVPWLWWCRQGLCAPGRSRQRCPLVALRHEVPETLNLLSPMGFWGGQHVPVGQPGPCG